MQRCCQKIPRRLILQNTFEEVGVWEKVERGRSQLFMLERAQTSLLLWQL